MMADNNSDAQIECRGLWKIFGDKANHAIDVLRSGQISKDEAKERYDCVIGVADCSLKIRRGEIFCIMGLSGSGKSTLLRHINRLIEPTAGQVIINGQDISRLDRKELLQLRSKTIGMVFQHMALWPHRNIRDNVAYGLEVRGVGAAKRHETAGRVLEQVQLNGWDQHYPDELSGGMQQRVGLARALAADPDILLMDEPFSALDPLIRAELQTQFLELSAAIGKTTLFVTHDLQEAIRMGTRVAIMKDGVVVQIGTPNEILVNPADDYVRSFVKGVSPLRYLTAEAIMEPIAQSSQVKIAKQSKTKNCVRPDAGLEELIAANLKDGQSVVVDDGSGAVGTITTQGLLSAIKDRLD